MSKAAAMILVGAVFGYFLGSSAGIAFGGSAYNASIFLAPLGAFIGWLAYNKNNRGEQKTSDNNEETNPDESECASYSGSPASHHTDIFGSLLWSGLALAATVWNFQIDLLRTVGLLRIFVQKPYLFVAMCIIISIFFPPFLVFYFCVWLGANNFGLSEENDYRVEIK